MQLYILVVAAALLGFASASPNENAFDFNYGFNPAVISMEMVDYADSEGTALRVPYVYLHLHPSLPGASKLVTSLMVWLSSSVASMIA